MITALPGVQDDLGDGLPTPETAQLHEEDGVVTVEHVEGVPHKRHDGLGEEDLVVSDKDETGEGWKDGKGRRGLSVTNP